MSRAGSSERRLAIISWTSEPAFRLPAIALGGEFCPISWALGMEISRGARARRLSKPSGKAENCNADR
jgi:hypothetical protein